MNEEQNDTSYKDSAYALETAGLFVSGLGMLLLVIVCAWMMAAVLIGSRNVTAEFIGTAPRLSLSRAEIANIGGFDLENGQVAGIVDEVESTELQLRNEVASWLSSVRSASGQPSIYRDSIIDRNAQNHARLLADRCDDNVYNDWSETIGSKVDSGYVGSFSESTFAISGTAFASELPAKEIDYQRLFTDVDAYGIGVAETTAISGCQSPYMLVIHLAQVK